jgi:hypothetical protein
MFTTTDLRPLLAERDGLRCCTDWLAVVGAAHHRPVASAPGAWRRTRGGPKPAWKKRTSGMPK